VLFCHGWSNSRMHLGKNGFQCFILPMKREVNADEEIDRTKKN